MKRKESIVWVNEPTNLSKKELTARSAVIITRVKNGEVSALEAYLISKGIEKIAKNIQEGIKDEALTEARLYNERDREKMGTKFNLGSGRTSYDYEADPEYRLLKAELKRREGLLDEAINASEKGLTVLDPATGEIISPPPIKSSTGEFITVTFQ